MNARNQAITGRVAILSMKPARTVIKTPIPDNYNEKDTNKSNKIALRKNNKRVKA